MYIFIFILRKLSAIYRFFIFILRYGFIRIALFNSTVFRYFAMIALFRRNTELVAGESELLVELVYNAVF